MNKSINTIKMLSMDMITNANSGHPGICLGASPIMYTLYKDFLKVNPEEPNWFNRDRFVLSAGHGSAMLYATLFLSGYNLSIEDLKNFRQLNSKTPGHPENFITPGVDASTGPLGQGIAMAVGMAYSEQFLAKKYNKEDLKLIDNYTYVLCGDGDLMEGISYEAMSLAGKLELNKLIVLYDSNGITLDGKLDETFNENIEFRMKAQNWDYILVENGTNYEEIKEAIKKGKNNKKPTLIEVKTIIGDGCCKAGTNAIHGKPLSKEELIDFKEKMNYEQKEFYVDEDVKKDFSEIKIKGREKYNKWEEKLIEYKNKYPKEYRELIMLIDNKKENLVFKTNNVSMSTREAINECINEFINMDTNFITGSADLFSSNLTNLKEAKEHNLAYGVREFAMGAIANGINLHSNMSVLVSTFLVFSDYLKPAARLSALMKLPIIYTFTHDSIYVGEDGPTHQPIEQLSMFRTMPNILTFRPASVNQTKACFKIAYEQKRTPSVLALSRQKINLVDDLEFDDVYKNVKKGAYVIYGPENAQKTIFATGSEVELAIEIAKELKDVKVVNVICMELFFQQEKNYINEILGDKNNNFVIEFGASLIWNRFTNDENHIFGIDQFGYSGIGEDIVKKLGLTKENILNKIKG